MFAPPLLSTSTEPPHPLDHSPKKTTRKLRRRNPPPSLSANHQKLPSSAGSSTIELAKRPGSSRSTGHASGGWFSRAALTGGRKSIDAKAVKNPEAPPVPLAENPTILTPPGSLASSQSDSLQPAAALYIGSQGKKLRPFSAGDSEEDIHMVGGLMSGAPAQRQSMIEKLPDPNPKTKTYPIDDEFLLPPTAPFAKAERSVPSERPASNPFRASNGSPSLPPLPQFDSGSFGFPTPSESRSGSSFSQDSATKDCNSLAKPPLSPKHPARKFENLSTPQSPPRPDSSSGSTLKATSQASIQSYTTARDQPTPVSSDESIVYHAVTTEEPIVLPTRPSTQSSEESIPSPAPQPPKPKKREGRASFLGGWKLSMRPGHSESSRDTTNTPIPDTPIGVGAGGGWVYRRRGSFSSPRPPSADKAQHQSYAQEYKEFRNSKGLSAANSTPSSNTHSTARSSKSPRSSTSPTDAATTFAARAAMVGVKPPTQRTTQQTATAKHPLKTSGSTRKSFMEKMKSVEARFNQKHAAETPAPVARKNVDDNELVALDVAVKQMNFLEEQLKYGRPLSPPDSRDGEKEPVDQANTEKGKGRETKEDITVAPLIIVKTNKSAENSPHESALSSSSSSTVSVNRQPAPPPGHSLHKKTKSLSPLRNEVSTSSPPPVDPATRPDASTTSSSSRHSASSAGPPPSEYLGQSKSLATTKSAASRPPTPPKPVAKLFVICCRCKFWHDLPSAMYRGMVESGGATRCPYCLHGMEVGCCSGYTCVVYMHQRHH